MSNVKSAYLQCDCNHETVVFTRYDYGDKDTDFEISVQDSYCGVNSKNKQSRIKRAWRALVSKPINYAEIYVEDPEKIQKFLNECLELVSQPNRVAGSVSQEGGGIS